MVQFEWAPLAFGTIMASIDVVMLGIIKSVSLNQSKLLRWMIIPTIAYAIQPWIFLQSLKFESLIVMNLMWDLISDILVTLVGVFYFKEQVGPYKTIGVVLSLISMTFMSITDGTWEDFLGKK
jgi:multidrug transporter EmrE-like cation transporter